MGRGRGELERSDAGLISKVPGALECLSLWNCIIDCLKDEISLGKETCSASGCSNKKCGKLASA